MQIGPGSAGAEERHADVGVGGQFDVQRLGESAHSVFGGGIDSVLEGWDERLEGAHEHYRTEAVTPGLVAPAVWGFRVLGLKEPT